MATKAQIITLTQDNLTGNPSRTTRTQHEAYVHSGANSILNELYKTSNISDNESTTNVFTILVDTSLLKYKLNITKQGGIVNVNGSLTNKTASPIPSFTYLLEITNSEYLCSDDNGQPTQIIGTNGNGDVIRLNLFHDDQKILLLNTLFGNETIYINTNYTAGQ